MMMKELPITSIEKMTIANRMLIDAKSLDDILKINTLAETARAYAKTANLGIETQNIGAEIALRSKRKAGEILVQLEREQGKRNDITSPNDGESSEYAKVLKDTGTTDQNASRWQQIASLPAETFEQYIAETKGESKELTTAGMLRIVQEEKRKTVHEKTAGELPNGKFRVFYADPPWQYNDSGVITENDNYGHAERHYPTMSIPELCALPILGLVEDNAVLFLWVTSPLLEDAFTVIHAWGFEYKTSFVWDKVRHNFGHYNSVRHELLLVCTRGNCTPDHLQLFDSVQTIERTETHSEKPEEFRKIIETLYTHGSRIELFARHNMPGWEAWGNEPNIS